MDDIKFSCSKCGRCCKYVDKMLINYDKAPFPYNIELKNFPYKAKEDGSCEMYSEEENICVIYEDRPILCNIEKMYEKYFRDKMTKEDYFKKVKESCEKLKLL